MTHATNRYNSRIHDITMIRLWNQNGCALCCTTHLLHVLVTDNYYSCIVYVSHVNGEFDKAMECIAFREYHTLGWKLVSIDMEFSWVRA